MRTVTCLGECKEWLTSFIADHDGEVSAKEVKSAAKELGYSNGTLWRAATDIGVESRRIREFASGTVWKL